MYDKVKSIVQKVTRATAYAGMALLVPMMLLTSLDVVTSKAWARPIPGSMELSSFMLSVIVLLGVAYTHQMRGHVRVTMLTDRLPGNYGEILNVITTLLTLFITCIVLWQGVIVAFEAHDVSDMLRIPSLPFRLLVSVAALLLALELVFDIVDSTRSLMR
jgi:TRAP-type C4-dicarboxylate transport system permease small subunit